MESSSLATNPVTTMSNRARQSKTRKKKIKTSSQNHNQMINTYNNKISWKSESTQRLYSTKLLQALRHVRQRRGRAVRETADRVLAVAARGRMRWSRAILAPRLRLKCINRKHKRQIIAGKSPAKNFPVGIMKVNRNKIPFVQRKVKMLGRLVPGCRKETLPVILEEATDYIPALEMQIRAMREILSRITVSRGIDNDGEGSSSESMIPENEVV